MENYNSVLLDGALACDPIEGVSEKGTPTANFALLINVNTVAGNYCDTAPVKVISNNLVTKCMDLLKEDAQVRVVGRLAITDIDWCIVADHIEIKHLQL